MSFTGWNEIMKGRKEAASRLPHLFKLPIVASGRDLLLQVLKKGSSLLDIGANDRNIERFLKEKGMEAEYRSFDVDRGLEHDYYDLKEIDRTFDAAVLFDVIEHMSVKEAAGCFAEARRLLKKGGVFVVSTPNVCHPVVLWRDCTHITAFRYDELYGLLASAGFEEIRVYRCGSFSLKDRLVAFLFMPLLRLLRIDYAPGIVAVGINGEQAG
ncbi:MAG: methyltransferase domain-containing protein [Deltaproteobacteria bacterium]|nr:methyltransferase domain-containing protein [Deltaproteobacteria bacterium]